MYGPRIIAIWSGLAAITFGIAGFAFHAVRQKPASSVPQPSAHSHQSYADFRRQHYGDFTVWWDTIPDHIQADRSPAPADSNIHPKDYAGPDACKNCHKKQYESWSEHPHRWMNSLIQNVKVRGDFNDHRMSYLGGEVRFYQVADQYRMRLERGDVRKVFAIEQTIGSRFFQYYVGKQLEGPEAAGHPLYTEAHVLPLGYWIDRQEWVPVVHVHFESHEKQRHDPFVARPEEDGDFNHYAEHAVDIYRNSCNFCHTTFPIGDMFLRMQKTFGRHVPTKLDLALASYVQNSRPELWPADQKTEDTPNDAFVSILKEYHRSEASTHAVTLGISCEACHLGTKDHAQGKLKRPRFFPTGPEVFVRSEKPEYDFGRTHDNVNWACGRCHAGNRPLYANGISTWNSTEYSDAMKGSCYSQLTCIRCHNPHESIGHEWSRTAAQDDAVCLSCHQKFEPEQARQAHTHHSLGNEGSRCMNCHMPRINEGLQEVVRTHTIFSPTDPSMIAANQMNACNLCHVDQPISWAVNHLNDWYGKAISKKSYGNHPHRKQPAVISWLRSENESVRLVAADALARANARWALPDLIGALDDPFLLNRQFARIGIEKMLNIKLSDYGYKFYQTPEERLKPLKQLKEQVSHINAEPKSGHD